MVGKLLWILGWALVIWSSLVGLPFIGLFLLGFVASGGREYGGELAGMLLLATAGIVSGLIVIKLGKWLGRSGKRDA
ncbi:hypothetical protein [Dokdonella sp.]|uniref:hypothetical protein n=1 Tax=Dokdonella sp. TaxID=2291710 RepID=UPI003527E8D9